ncbi:MAG: hypothetical protein WKF37_14800 [Bryobacteraceae bacterium]
MQLRSCFDLPPNLFDGFVTKAHHDVATRLADYTAELTRIGAVVSNFNAYLSELDPSSKMYNLSESERTDKHDPSDTFEALNELVRRSSVLLERARRSSPDEGLVARLTTEAASARIWAGELAQARAKQSFTQKL